MAEAVLAILRIISGLCFIDFETFFRNGTWLAAEGAGASDALRDGNTEDMVGCVWRCMGVEGGVYGVKW